jgi:hypothetical protein
MSFAIFMTMDAKKDGFSTFFNWFAWAISLGASAFFITYDVIPSFPGILSGTEKEMLIFMPLLLIAIAGCITSLFKPKVGTLMMLVGAIGMSVDLYIRGGPKMAGMMIVYSGPYLLAALIIAIMRKRV